LKLKCDILLSTSASKSNLRRYSGGAHRLHGKRLPGRYLGIITTENITDVEGLTDQAWNPLDEYIYDVSSGWMDQRCTCSAEWQGLTLVQDSAQPEPFLSLKLNNYSPKKCLR